jgi:3-oxoacyl-[acyl-carrier protein] reductase
MRHKNALITGATSGIAVALSKLLLKENYNLALMLKNDLKIPELKKSFGKLGIDQTVRYYACDVARADDMKQTFARIRNDFPRIDALVTLAGMSHGKKLEDDSAEIFEHEVAVNLTGTYLSILETYQSMPEDSAIVTVGSSRGRTGTPKSSVGYAAAKAGVMNLTKTCALQLAKYRIRVNCVAPYYVHPSPFTAKYGIDQLKQIAEAVPLKQLSTHEDIANAIYFLLSDKSRNITGHTLDIDGGVWMN